MKQKEADELAGALREVVEHAPELWPLNLTVENSNTQPGFIVVKNGKRILVTCIEV